MCSVSFHEVMGKLTGSFFPRFGFLNLAKEKWHLKIAKGSEH